jgi:uncharacterized protein DUF3124
MAGAAGRKENRFGLSSRNESVERAARKVSYCHRERMWRSRAGLRLRGPETLMGKRVIPSLMSMALLVLAGAAGAQEQAPNNPRDFLAEFQQSLVALPDAKTLSVQGAIYVPAYHNIRGSYATGSGLATLLRIDNTSSSKPLVLERIDYFDTAGKLVQRYLTTPVALKPFGAIQIFIPTDDARGGPAANFIITWAGNAPIAEPLTESVMFGKVDGAGYSFVSQGRAIRTVGKKHWFGFGLAK